MLKFLVLSILFLNLLSLSQEAETKLFENNSYGLKLEIPSNWIEKDNDFITDNFEQMDLDEQTKEELLANNGFLLLGAFAKYDETKHQGLIPVIQLRVKPSPVVDSVRVVQSLAKSFDNFKGVYEDFKFVEEPKIIEINGREVAYAKMNFSLGTNLGYTMEVQSIQLGIATEKHIFQFSFTGGQEEENEDQLFQKIIQTIEID